MHALEGSEDSKNSERPDHRLALARRISTTKDNNDNNNNNNIVNNYRSCRDLSLSTTDHLQGA